MIKTFCKKCKALNIVNLNIQGDGKIQMPCNKCGHTMVFDGSKKINFKKKENTMEQEIKETSFIERLAIEVTELENKIIDLREFTKTDKFKSLSALERVLLTRQFDQMTEYLLTITARLSLYQDFTKKL